MNDAVHFITKHLFRVSGSSSSRQFDVKYWHWSEVIFSVEMVQPISNNLVAAAAVVVVAACT